MSSPLDSLGPNPTTDQIYTLLRRQIPVPQWVLLALEYVDENAYQRGRSGLRAEFTEPGGVELNGMTIHAMGTDTIEVHTYRTQPTLSKGDQYVSITAEPHE